MADPYDLIERIVKQPAAGQIAAALQSAPATANLFYEVEIEPASWEDRKPVRP